MHDPLSRRQALQRLGVLGVGAVASACGSNGGGAGAIPTATASATAPATSAPTATPTPPPTATPTAPATGTATPAPTASMTAAPSATATTSPTTAPTDTPAPPSPTATPSATVTPEQIDCILTPSQILGPYFIDVGLVRSDIREDRDGVPLRLALQLVDSNGCTPIRDAVVNVWHADANGAYSGFAGQPGGVDTRGETFLRGFQVTGADGRVEFATIYPGWYVGRTIHIHVRIHLDATTLLVTQVYFPDAVTAAVQQLPPYASKGPSDTDNDADGIFDELLVLELDADGDGYVAAMVIGVDR